MAAIASHHERQQLISDEWTDQVEELLRPEEPLELRRATTRVPNAMVNAKADAYIPQMVSLGPHHHHTLKVVSAGPYEQIVTHMSQMDLYKLKFAREAAGRNAAVIKQMATELTKPPFVKRVKDFYNCSIGANNTRELQNFSLMMTVDAFFLFQFLKKHADDDHCMPSFSCVRCDIVKLENQIPLFLLLKVRDAVPAETQSRTPSKPFDLLSQVQSLSTFQTRSTATKKLLEEEEHLLGCIHKYVSSFLQIQPTKQDKKRPSCWQQISCKTGSVAAPVGRICGSLPDRAPEGQHDPATEGHHDYLNQGHSDPSLQGQHDFLKRYNAEGLSKAGISFKPIPNDPLSKIRFDKLSRTLYLPKIEVVGTYTEVMLRNLMALEFNDASGLKPVTEYVTLMDCLIDSARDVKLLRVRGVIVWRSMMITDEYVAEMWNGLLKPLSALGGMMVMEAPLALISEIDQLLNLHFYKTRFRTLAMDFGGLYLRNPWQMIGLVVRTFLVLVVQFMVVVQFRLGWGMKGLCRREAPSPSPSPM